MSTKEGATNSNKHCDWLSGNEPMTDALASDLQILSEQARLPFTLGKDLTKVEAFKLIGELRRKAGVEDTAHETWQRRR
ncbi:DUF3072 domain-containing protein [Bradyrhizobium sp. USDA 3364]